MLARSTPQRGSTGPAARAYLDVPYAEKDVAKALGERWDQIAKRWYDPRPHNGLYTLSVVAFREPGTEACQRRAICPARLFLVRYRVPNPHPEAREAIPEVKSL